MKPLFFIITLALTTLSVTPHIGWSDSYKDARKKITAGERPWFVDEQIQRNENKQPAQLPQAIALPEVDMLMGRYHDESSSSLASIIQIVEPALLSQEGIQIQNQADSQSIDKLMTGKLDVTIALNVAYRRNPSIQAASQAWQAALQRYPQGAYLEGILRQYNSFTKRLDLLLGGMQPQKQMVDTDWPFPGIVSLRGDIIQTDIEIAKQDFSIALRDVLANTKKAFHEFVYIDRAIEVTRENQELLKQMLDVASQKFETGNTAYNDVIKARVALSKLTDAIITLEDQRETIIARLNTIFDRAPHASIGPLVSPPIKQMQLKIDRLYEIAKQNRQEIQQMQSKVERTRLLVDMAQEMNRPDPTLGASYFQERSGLLVGAEPDRSAFQPAPRQPIRPWFGQREAFIAEMQIRRQQLSNKLEGVINQTLFEVKSSHFSVDAAYRESELYRTTLIPEAQQSLEVAEADYQGARTDFLDYLDAQRTWLDFNLVHYNAQRSYGVTLAELERVVGASLDSIQQ